jgi:tetratricopeptide (TPR) repeat protein
MKALAQEPDGESREAWLGLCEEILSEVETTADAGERAALLCRVAEIYERRLADPDNALVSLQAAFKEHTGSGRVVQEMERLARSSGRWAEVIASTAEVADTVIDARQAADLWVQIAFWNDTGLGALDQAADAAGRALALAPGHGGALALLEGLYRRQQRWDLFVDVLGKKWNDPYRDHYKIAEGYAEVLRYEPQHLGALAGLARLQEEASQWEAAAETLGKLVAAVPEAERANAHHRLGVIRLERLSDPRGAEEQLVQALALAPEQTHLPSMLSLIDIYRARGDWLKARQLLGRAAEAVESSAGPSDKIRYMFDAAEICRTRLDDDVQAAELYAQVVALDPAHTAAAEPLAEILFRRGAWASLLRVVETLIADEGRPAAERARLHHWMARAAAELGDDDRALSAFRASFAADAGYLPTLRDFGALAFKREAWTEAAASYEGLLASHGTELRRDEILDALERQGIALLRAGEPARALAPLERALAMDPRRRATLEALVEATTVTEDFDAVVRHAQALLPLIEGDGPDARVALHERIAEIHRDRRGDPQRAIAAYLAALEARPDGRKILHELLELYSATKQWKQAVGVLTRLADLDQGAARAAALVAAGNILHYELGADAEAVDVYDQALDADPEDLKTFERIDKLTTATHDWKTQERCYRRQIKRMGSDVPLEKRPALLALWQGLGEIYRSRLKDIPAAIAAFEVAASLDPDNVERRADTGKILAELYQAAGPETYAKAVGEHRRLIELARSPGEMAEHLKLLLRLFVELGEVDHAFCAAQSLVVLGRADADERALYEQYRPPVPVRARSRMTEELWQRNLCHPEQDRLLSQILSTVSPAVAMVRAKPHKEWGLKRKQRRDVASDPAVFCKALAYVGAILSVPWPEVYLFPDSPGEIDLVNARETMATIPSFLVGRGALEGRTEMELAFILARNLTMMRPDHVLRWPTVVPKLAELEAAARAAIKLVAPEIDVPPEQADAVAQYAELFRGQLAPQLIEQLGVLIGRFAAGGATLNVGRWARAVTLTAIRAGLLISGDLEVASRLGQAAVAATTTDIEPGDVALHLASWNVSESYFTLRSELGLGVVGGG